MVPGRRVGLWTERSLGFLLLALFAVLVLGYILHPSVRERVFSSSPSYSVGTFRRRMHALGHQSGHESRWLDEPVYTATAGRQVLVPAKPIGASPGATATSSPAAAPTPIDTVLNPEAPERRRQAVQIVLGAGTGFFLLAGFFSRPLWIGAFVFLVLFLGYLGLLHEATKREQERVRRSELARVTRRQDQPAVPEPVQQVQRGYTIDLTDPEPQRHRGFDHAPGRGVAYPGYVRSRSVRPETEHRHGPPRGHSNGGRSAQPLPQRRPLRRPTGH